VAERGVDTPEDPADPAADVRDDHALLRAHVAGDPDAFRELVRRHRDRCWSLALRTLGDREEAADAVQDALLAAHRSAAGFRGDAQVSTWLHRVVLNACLDRLRRRRARPTVPLDDALPAHVLAVDPPPTELRLDIAAALADLPPDQRAAIVLVDLADRSVAEAARLLGVPEGTVKSRCSRGRVRLALALGHLHGVGNPSDRAAVGPQGSAPALGSEEPERPDPTTSGGAR